MSDTPETDVSCGYALSSHYGRLEGSYLQMDWSGPFVHAEVARKLERERDEAREHIERQRLEIVRLNGATNHAGGTPLKIALRERDEAREERENCKSIVDKAKELIARWDQPSWKDTAPTAGFIYALRDAVEAYEKGKK